MRPAPGVQFAGGRPLRVALIGGLEGVLTGLAEALELRGFRTARFLTVRHCRQESAAGDWCLALLDARGASLRPALEELLSLDVGLPVAVLSGLTEADFHDQAEGLGVLTRLSGASGTGELESLLDQLRAVGGLDPALEAAQGRLDAARRHHHPGCVVCWDHHPFGLKVDFLVTGIHTVIGTFPCGPSYEGYAGVIHGGVVSSLLDGAMASCMLAKGLEAYTVELRVRFRAAVAAGTPARIRAAWLKGDGPLHLLQANLEQQGVIRASARAKFFEGTPDQPSQPMPCGDGLRRILNQARKRLT